VTSVLDRLPPWATTGVGSLPHADPGTAAAQAVRGYDLPFCPQLPALDGDMVAEWLGAEPRRSGWSAERDREPPRAWVALLAELAVVPPEHRVVKLQVTGPVTLACALERGGGARDDGLLAALAAWLAADVAARVAVLRERGLEALVVVDEPALAAAGDRAGIARCWDPLRALGVPWGLHLCCAVPWDVVDRAAPDVLSLDLVITPVDRRAVTSLHALLARGGRVAWGVLPVDREESPALAAARLDAAIAGCGAAGERSLLTPSCGTGRQSRRRETLVARVLRELARARRAPPRRPS